MNEIATPTSLGRTYGNGHDVCSCSLLSFYAKETRYRSQTLITVASHGLEEELLLTMAESYAQAKFELLRLFAEDGAQ